MIRTVLFLAMLFSVGASVASAGQRNNFDTSRLSKDGQKAYRLLIESEMFALVHAGSLTGQEPALLRLLVEFAAVDALISLVEEGSPEDRLYGLLGLRQLDAKLLEGGAFESVGQARGETFSCIEGYYNRARRRSA